MHSTLAGNSCYNQRRCFQITLHTPHLWNPLSTCFTQQLVLSVRYPHYKFKFQTCWRTYRKNQCFLFGKSDFKLSRKYFPSSLNLDFLTWVLVFAVFFSKPIMNGIFIPKLTECLCGAVPDSALKTVSRPKGQWEWRPAQACSYDTI